MNNKLPLIIFSFLFIAISATQVTGQSKKGVVYDKEMSGGLQIMPNGWSLLGQYGILQTYYKTRLYTLEFGELKSAREKRQTPQIQRGNPTFNPSSGYIFGKQNNFYSLKAGFGEKYYLSEKAARKGVAVGLSYSFGPSLGLIKPYYLEIARSEPGQQPTTNIKYSEATAVEFLSPSLIYGSASSALGLDELSIAPGAFAKFGVHLDWGAYDETLKALEVGISADMYFKNIPIMVSDDNQPYFINVYAAAIFGKRK